MSKFVAVDIGESGTRFPQWPFRCNLDSPQADALQGWWPFVPGDGGSFLRDLSGNNRHATGSHNATLTRNEYLGWAINFTGGTGSRPSVSLSTHPALNVFESNGEGTVMFWAQGITAEQLNAAALSFSGTDDLVFYPFDVSAGGIENEFRIFWRDLTGVSFFDGGDHSPAIHHFAFSSSAGNNHRVYVDGALIGTSSASGSEGPFSNFQIGHFDDSQTCDCLISDVRIYSKALTDADIALHYKPSSRWELYEGERTMVLFPVAAAGGTTFNRTLVESYAFTDTAARTATLGRTLTESLALTDPVARTATLARVLTESLAFLDESIGVIGGTVFNRTLTEALAFTDESTRVATFLRVLAENLSLADVATVEGGEPVPSGSGRSMTERQMRALERRQLLEMIRRDDDEIVAIVTELLRNAQRRH